ncbi:Similar to Itfg2: KICSTOR complex protein ITFG2 (Mus musculus) [Cotesia congregata]|uniref:Similar to Itfg2: KICSTOR complex protein ITFG2 (Mus musculus) n=1 Tax=Cotesia congregata TaxID=51543 RepID=A0A8J2MVQ1_COTCN|nr:Similar to Itfg2: KICSTOR complex protein ITFG2 (Mus musculus) [Cotesia congregata]
MRAVNFVQRLQWDINGNVLTHGIVIGDVDNDGDNELVVGTSEGELYIFKGTEVWHKTTGLGLISCVAIGDIFNYGRNALVVVCSDGWVHIYYSPRSVNPSTNSTYSQVINKEFLDKMGGINFDHFSSSAESDQLSSKMECVHLQRIPTNTKFILIADVDRDGANEMILGLTDRVVRSYRWSSNADLGTGKLIGLNKWECANQIGTVTLQHTSDGTPTLLVAQPGGTFMRIKCNRDDCELRDDDSKNEAAASCVDYQTLGISRMRNPNISTAIIGNLEPGTTKFLVSDESPPKFVPKDTSVKHTFESSTKEKKKFKTGSLEFKRNYSQLDTRKRSLDESAGKRDNIIREPTRVDEGSSDVDQVDGNVLGGNIILGDFESNPPKKSVLPTYNDFSHTKLSSDESTQEDVDVNVNSNDKVIINSKPYALATLDGTIMLVKDEIILWAMQVDHLIFALSRLDVTGDGSDKIVVCAWDGHTYFLDQECNSVRFQFEESVRAFCAGNYSLSAGTSTPSLVYATFTNKIFLYYDVMLPSMLAKGLDPLESLSPEQKKMIDNLFGECSDSERDKKMQQLTEYLLYGMKVDEYIEVLYIKEDYK